MDIIHGLPIIHSKDLERERWERERNRGIQREKEMFSDIIHGLPIIHSKNQETESERENEDRERTTNNR